MFQKIYSIGELLIKNISETDEKILVFVHVDEEFIGVALLKEVNFSLQNWKATHNK